MNNSNSINVICLKWGNKYSVEYVNKLYHMVTKNLSHKHAFYCLTDDADGLSEGIVPLLLEENLFQGWWYKLLLFKENFYGLTGTLLFFDLDVVITNSINCLLEFEPDKPFVISKDWSENQLRYDGVNSSIFRLKIGSIPHTWDMFQRNHTKITKLLHGDQDWIDLVCPDYNTFPKEWVVPYKYGVCTPSSKRLFFRPKPKGLSTVPQNCKVVIFNGRPNPSDVAYDSYDKRWQKASWILTAWEE